MAADAAIGRAVVKSAATGESARSAPRRRRKAAAHRPVPLRPASRLHVEHSVDSAISLAKRSDSLSRATVFFFRDCTVRVLPEVLQNNATQKDDTLRAHQARGKSTPNDVSAPCGAVKRGRGNARRSAATQSGGVVRVQCCHCRGEQLIRSPGLREARRPPRGSSSAPFRVPVVTETTITTYDKDDDSEGVMRQGILSLLWLAG